MTIVSTEILINRTAVRAIIETTTGTETITFISKKKIDEKRDTKKSNNRKNIKNK